MRIAVVKVPTTHDHPDGVAAGIVAGLARLLAEHAIDPEQIAFIAHSTTQATNALLEGDLARVGVACFGGPLARAAMRFRPIPLGPTMRFAPQFFAVREETIEATVAQMRASAVEAVVASDAFGVDRPARERALVAHARSCDLAATCGSEVASMYGLRARTRTAALNAAILPRMLRTARMTQRAVADARIPAPLMIMRSDGGVMDVAEVERRPILTMLSGPAAGIAGALFHENVTDGIFIEVGGTSADCSVIRRGRPQIRPARIGGHRTLLRTLDVRTLGVAGGSLAAVASGRVLGVGPRSAHIAGYRYAAFCSLDEIAQATIDLQDGIAALRGANGPIAITPTCAANVLDLVPQDAFARGNAQSARLACERVGAAIGLAADALARGILDATTATLRTAIDTLIAEYELDRASVEIVGGGGGAAALVPYAARALGVRHRIARDAEVISPLGVALALVQDVVERTIVDPTPSDLARVRAQALDAAVRSGADPQRVEVVLEVDRTRNRVRATASGATALIEGAQGSEIASEAERCEAAARALHCALEQINVSARTPQFTVFAGPQSVAIVDERAIVRVIAPRAAAYESSAGEAPTTLVRAIEAQATYGDVGRALPDVWMILSARLIEWSGVADPETLVALARDELASYEPSTPLVIVAAAKRA